MFFSFSHPSGVKVIFEDDGRCAYAYLLDEAGKIVGDVWIYNADLTPDEREWEGDDSDAPYRNPTEYVRNHPFPRVKDEADIAVSFGSELAGTHELVANVYIRDRLAAVVKPNARPGWAANACADGPLALKLDPTSLPKSAITP